MNKLETFCRTKMLSYSNTVAFADMEDFLTSKQTMGKGLKLMIEGIELYCRTYAKHNNAKIGQDGFLGIECKTILKSLHHLLSRLGRFDGGTLSAFICDTAKENGLDID